MNSEDKVIEKFGLDKLYKIQNNDAEMTSEEEEFVYELFCEDMPYGTAKARTGDPSEWIYDRLCEIEITEEEVTEIKVANKDW